MIGKIVSFAERLRPGYRLRQLSSKSVFMAGHLRDIPGLRLLLADLGQQFPEAGKQSNLLSIGEADRRAGILRSRIRAAAGLSATLHGKEPVDELWPEAVFLYRHGSRLRPYFEGLRARRALYAGQCYYNHWYLSRGLRDLGWRADVLNWDSNPSTQIFYHGEDIHFSGEEPYDLARDLRFYLEALYSYDIVHFANAHGICFGFSLQALFEARLGRHAEIRLLRKLGKKICYTNNGCLDGVTQTSFAKWGPESVCTICRWRDVPEVCSDRRNGTWGAFRNSVTDYQCLLGGNRADFNTAQTVHESPEVYCLDKDFWDPDLQVPQRMRLATLPEGTIRLYHSVGNKEARTRDDGTSIKCTHIYLPLIERLRAEGHRLELISPTDVPNRDVRFLQMQADIFLEMLTFGWFGANAREAMMLGKPVICFIRPEWLDSLRAEIPDYADELPVVSATPDTLEQVLRDLVSDKRKRLEIGRRSREFAIKWHSKETSARHFDVIYRELLCENPLLLEQHA